MPRELSEQVVVITGASSGIGREAALRFGARGAAVVLAARNEAALRTAADEVERRGGRALVVVTDVASWPQMERLAREAHAHFGRIDTWVNNAGLSVYGTAEQLTVEEIDRIIQVDLLGTIYGVKAALPALRAQGEGTIINVSSVAGVRGVALQAPYSAAKHGIKGFTEALRLELARDLPGVRVTLILPASINTPFFRHARTKSGVNARPIPPVYEPGLVADAIVLAAESPRRDIFVGGAAKMFDVMERVSPSLTDWYHLQGDNIFKTQMGDRPDGGPGNLMQPPEEPGAVAGEYGPEVRPSPYTRAFEFYPGLKPLALGVTALGAVALWQWWRNGSGRRESSRLARAARSAADALP